MKVKKQKKQGDRSRPGREKDRGHIFSTPNRDKHLDPVQLNQLEQAFRDWTHAAARPDVYKSRQRILLIFLFIRYTGAKLSEVLNLDPNRDIDESNRFVILGGIREGSEKHKRKAPLSEPLCREIRAIIDDLLRHYAPQDIFTVDPGFVRRKFYERSEACGIPKQLGAPEMIRRARAVELMQNNMPLPAVQMLLGHSTPNPTSSYVTFSEDDIDQVTRMFMEKESARKTSARNTFFGKIQSISGGDIQTRVELTTIGGHRVTTIITNDSCRRLGLKPGKLITAEVKAPWVILQKEASMETCSADNIFEGVVEKITQGKINSEYVIRISDGTEICALLTTESHRRLALSVGDEVLALFNGYSVVLLSE